MPSKDGVTFTMEGPRVHVIATGNVTVYDALYDLSPSGILKCKFITYTDVPCYVNFSGQVFLL